MPLDATDAWDPIKPMDTLDDAIDQMEPSIARMPWDPMYAVGRARMKHTPWDARRYLHVMGWDGSHRMVWYAMGCHECDSTVWIARHVITGFHGILWMTWITLDAIHANELTDALVCHARNGLGCHIWKWMQVIPCDSIDSMECLGLHKEDGTEAKGCNGSRWCHWCHELFTGCPVISGCRRMPWMQ